MLLASNLDDFLEFSAILVIICSHDGRGELIRLNWSHFARDSHLDAPVDQVTLSCIQVFLHHLDALICQVTWSSSGGADLQGDEDV